MKILVTGATGFIGKNLVEFLSKPENEIDCLIRKTSDTSFLKKHKVKLIKGDLNDKNSLKLGRYNIVYHLAGAVGSKGYGHYDETNFKGTINLIESLEGLDKFIYLSSGSAFGDSDKIINEEMESNPCSDYGKSKRNIESHLLKMAEKGFPVIILRPPIVYGEHDDVKRDLSMLKLIKLVTRGNYFTIKNSGETRKSLCYVKNLVEAIELAGKSEKKGEVYFISDSSPSLDELAKKIAKIENIDLKKKNLSVELLENYAKLNEKIFGESADLNTRVIKGMLTTWVCDSSKAKKELGWKPKHDLKKSLKNTINWYKNAGILK
ncbi:MAG: NAD(P)-dependent oxidoreductase [Nanoarchaeota archaeon]|nr:NAD(P)-dependent oxidoreductase [Nanoarchaeota archaeon]